MTPEGAFGERARLELKLAIRGHFIPRHNSDSPLEADHLAGFLKGDGQRFVNCPTAVREYRTGITKSSLIVSGEG